MSFLSVNDRNPQRTQYVAKMEAELQSLRPTVKEEAARAIKNANKAPTDYSTQTNQNREYDLPLQNSEGVGNYVGATRAFLAQSRSTERQEAATSMQVDPTGKVIVQIHLPPAEMDKPQEESLGGRILRAFQSKPTMADAIKENDARLSRLMVRATGLDW